MSDCDPPGRPSATGAEGASLDSTAAVSADIPEIGEPYTDQAGISAFRELMAQRLRAVGKEGHTAFPGCQPVSLAADGLERLRRNEYFVCEKTDGERRLLLLTKERAFLIDRNYCFRSLEFTVPLPPLNAPREADEPSVHHLTLLDGELVVSSRRSECIQLALGSLTFLAFDILLLNGSGTLTFDLVHRLRLIQANVILPYALHRSEVACPFYLALKPMYPAKFTKYVWEEIVPKLPHYSDGLVYTPVRLNYAVGTAPDILKWKPFELNTVDFKLVTRYDQGRALHQLWAKTTAELIYFGPVDLTREEELEFTNQGDVIVECRYDISPVGSDPENPTRGPGFRVLRVRRDKRDPNDINIVRKIVQSIQDNVTVDSIQALFTK